MLTKAFLPHLRQHLKTAKFLSCLPYYWNKGSGSLVALKSARFHFILHLQMLIHAAYATAQILSTIFAPYPLSKKLEGMFFTAVYTMGILVRWNWNLNEIPGEMGFLNSLIQFENKIFQGIKISIKISIFCKTTQS